MARRANYGFEKRQRELEKKKKKEAKAEKKRQMKEAAAALEEGVGEADDGETIDGEAGEPEPARATEGPTEDG